MSKEVTIAGPGFAIQEKEGAITVREEFGAKETSMTVETAAGAVAAQARAMIESRYLMALRRPRDLADVRSAILKECQRPGFAETALYQKPIGGKSLEGLSIRFAEAAVRALRNVEVDTPTVYDDATRRIVKVIVVDLESNTPWSKDLVIEKTVERKQLKRGQTALSSRVNSYGDTVYLVEATEDEVNVKEGALVSKVVRTLLLRQLPGDIQEEAKAAIKATLQNRAALDPDAEQKRVADAFGQLRVTPSDLREYLGHALDKCTPAELVNLRGVYSALKDGEATWPDILASKQPDAHVAKTATEKTIETLKGQAPKRGTVRQKPQPTPPPPPPPACLCFGAADHDHEPECPLIQPDQLGMFPEEE